MKRSDQPEIHIDTGAPFFRTNELKYILVLHPWQTVDLVFILPWLFILEFKKRKNSEKAKNKG